MVGAAPPQGMPHRAARQGEAACAGQAGSRPSYHTRNRKGARHGRREASRVSVSDGGFSHTADDAGLQLLLLVELKHLGDYAAMREKQQNRQSDGEQAGDAHMYMRMYAFGAGCTPTCRAHKIHVV